jgi:succinyl-CoA synthetase alpha subunit
MAFFIHRQRRDGASAPGKPRIGALPGDAQRGRIGIVSGSEALCRLAARQLVPFGLGAATVLARADGPAAPSHLPQLQLFDEDPGTDAVLLIGSLLPQELDDCAAWIVDHKHKPLVGFIDETDPAAAQRARLQACGVHMAREAGRIGELVASLVEPAWLPFD